MPAPFSILFVAIACLGQYALAFFLYGRYSVKLTDNQVMLFWALVGAAPPILVVLTHYLLINHALFAYAHSPIVLLHFLGSALAAACAANRSHYLDANRTNQHPHPTQ